MDLILKPPHKKSLVDTKNLHGNVRELPAGFEMHATSQKKPFAPTAGVIRLLWYVSMDRGTSTFCEMSAKVTDAIGRFCNSLWKVGDY